MVWVVEKRCEDVCHSPRSGCDIVWLDIESSKFFIMQQKLEDQSKIKSSLTGSQDSLILPEALRFQYVHPKCVIQQNMHYRITTKAEYSLNNTPLVIALATDSKTINNHWKTIREQIIPLFHQTGLYPAHSTDEFSAFDWSQLLLLQVVHLSNIEPEPNNELIVEITPKHDEPEETKAEMTLLAPVRKKRRRKRKSKTKSVQGSKHTKFSRSSSHKVVTTLALSAVKQDEDDYEDRPRSARVSEEAVMPLLDLQQAEVHKSEILECFQSFQLVDDKLLQARSCFIVTIDKNRKKLLVGVLMLSKGGYMCFYSKKTPLRLAIPFYTVERVHTNQNDQYPNNLSILTCRDEEFLFAGVGNIRQFTSAWSKLFSKRCKALQKIISKHSTMIRVSEEPHRRFRIFKKSAPSRIQFTTVDPLFDLCFRAVDEKMEFHSSCILLVPPVHQTLISGSLFVGEEDLFFVGANHSIVFNTEFSNIDSMEANDSGSSKEVLLSLGSVDYPILLQDVPNAVSELLLTRFMQRKSQEQDQSSLAHYTYTMSQRMTELDSMKQELIEKTLAPTSDYIWGLWKLYMKCHDKFSFRTDLLRRLIYAGIPNSLRGEVWSNLAGINEKRASSNEVSYGCMIQHFRDRISVATNDIKRDIHRSLPQHLFFQELQGRQTLEEILCMYSWRNESIGYCQSMNLICAMLLLYTTTENAYYLLSVVCENMLPNYYTPSMEGSLTDQQVLRSLMEEFIPDIDLKLKELDVPIAVITLPWFLCLFIHCVPLEVNLRIIDMFFAQGRPALFRFALAIFYICRDDIMDATDSMEVVFAIKESIQTIEADHLIRTSFLFNVIPVHRIDTLWAEHYPQVLKEIRKSNGSTELPVMPEQGFDAPSNRASTEPTPQVTFRRFGDQAPAQSFRLQQSNDDLRKSLLHAKRAPEVSHTTASLIYLIREGFTGQVLSRDSDTDLV